MFIAAKVLFVRFVVGVAAKADLVDLWQARRKRRSSLSMSDARVPGEGYRRSGTAMHLVIPIIERGARR